MAEVINIASFDFDPTRLEQSLDRLQTRFLELKKEQQDYNNVVKLAQQGINQLEKAQYDLIEAGEENSEQYKENEADLKKLNDAQVQNQKNSMNVASAMSRVRSEMTATTKQLQAYTNEEARFTTLANGATNALSKQINNINEARASNTEILRVRNQLNPTIAEEAKLIAQLNQRLDENNAFIKENASAYEQQKINIGNYSESIKTAFSDINIFNGGLAGFAQRSQEAGGAGALLGNSLKATTTATVGLTKAMLAFILTPVGAVLAIIAGVFLLIKNAMDKNKQSADKIAGVFGALGAIFNKVLKVLEPLGTYIIDVLVVAFETLGNVAQKAGELMADALDFLGFEETAEDIRTFTAETAEATKQAYEMAKAEREIELAQKAARLTQLTYQKEAEKLRQLRDDESRTLTQRIADNKALGALLDQQAQEELRIARLKLNQAIAQAQYDGIRKEETEAYIEALTNIADIEERITGQRSEQLANENSLRKEAADAEKTRREEAIRKEQERVDKAIKAQQTELAFYIESQGERKRSLEDQLKIEEEIRKRQQAIAKAEFDANKTTRREYQLALLEIDNEFAKKQMDMMLENADIEFEMFKMNNQRKLDENQFFSEQLYQQELDRINRLAEAEAAQRTREYQLGIINAEQYALAIAQIDANQQQANDDALAERDKAKRDKDALDYEIQSELNAQRFETDLALQMERYEREYAERKAIAEKNGADMIAFEQLEARKREEIERAVTNNKLALNAQALGNVAKLLGENSKAGKAFAIAQTTIDTYLGAQKAYTSQLIPGDPSSFVRAGLAAGAAVVSGLANVKKIIGTKEIGQGQQNPGYASGIIGLNGIGSGTSDSITANLSNGESVMTARATQMFPELLGTLNQIGGGVGLDGNTSSLIADSFNSSNNMAEMIAQAVMEGSAIGTASGTRKGMVDLSDNIDAMRNAKF